MMHRICNGTIAALMLLAGLAVAQAQAQPGPTPDAVAPEGPRQAQEPEWKPPGPPGPLTGRPVDPELLPYTTCATLELSDIDGGTGYFEIQINGLGQWRAVGTACLNPNGVVAEVILHGDAVFDPNDLEVPELTDAVVEGTLVYLYGIAAEPPATDILLIAPWSGYTPRGIGDWLEFLAEGISETVVDAMNKVVEVWKGGLAACVAEANATCVHGVKSLDYEVGAGGVNCHS